MTKRKKLRLLNNNKEVPLNDETKDISSDSDSDCEDDILLENSIKSEIQEFTFEFYDLKESFDESLTTLLKSMIPNPTLAYNVAHEISVLANVGTAVVCEGGDDVFAFATILPSSICTQIHFFNTILNNLNVVLRKNSTIHEEKKNKWYNVLPNGKLHDQIGFMIHRRFANFPVELVHTLHQNLYEDFTWSKNNDDSSENESNQFKSMTHFVLINNCHVDGISLTENSVCLLSGSALYDYFEDDVYSQYADEILLLKYQNFPLMFFSLIPIKKLRICIDELSSLCGK